MTGFMVIATVNEIEYLTRVQAESESSAEHSILGLSRCGKHTYGVTACMAYDVDAMKYCEFRYRAINAEPISLDALKEVIESRNKEIEEQDAAEERISAIAAQIHELQKQMDEARAILCKQSA